MDETGALRWLNGIDGAFSGSAMVPMVLVQSSVGVVSDTDTVVAMPRSLASTHSNSAALWQSSTSKSPARLDTEEAARVPGGPDFGSGVTATAAAPAAHPQTDSQTYSESTPGGASGGTDGGKSRSRPLPETLGGRRVFVPKPRSRTGATGSSGAAIAKPAPKQAPSASSH